MTTDRPNPAEALRQQLDDWLQPLLLELEQAERRSDWPAVERLCKQALQRDGENWSLWQQLARSHEERRDWPQAETLWRHLTQRFSSRPEPYLALAALQRRRGAPDAARVVLEEAERRVGRDRALSRELGVIDDPWAMGESIPTLTETASAQELARALQLAQAHLDAARLTEAEAVLNQILRVKPHAARVHLTLAQLRWRRGELDAVVQQLLPLFSDAEARLNRQERQPLLELLARALVAQERWQDAEAVLENLLEGLAGADRARVLAWRSDCAIGRGDDWLAQQLLQESLQLDPAQSGAQQRLGELWMRLGDWDAAITALSRALALAPEQRELGERLNEARDGKQWWRGETALRQGRWEEAAEAYRLLLQREGHRREALERLDLLASLSAEALEPVDESEAASEPEQRLQQFQRSLDQLEAQLKMLGLPL